MTLMRMRRAAQLTLPIEIRRALNVKDGDYLEAQVVKGGVLLKPVSLVERKRAWEGVRKVMSRVRDLEATPGEDPVVTEKWIATEVKKARRKHAS
jgi:AbrB family looped-hinge helix DNA binding protein